MLPPPGGVVILQMGGPCRRAAPILFALAALAVPVNAGAGALPTPNAKPAKLATTGHHSELVRSVPIATAPGSNERTAMSLGPDRLRRIEVGDRMRVSGEVQVSTTCVDRGPRCVGRRYEFNPTISARIVLSNTQEPIGASIPLSETRSVLCKQRRPNRNHHCTLVFPNVETSITDLATVPCPDNACYVNLIVGASHRKARRGNRVVLGADRPDGGVVQDKGRLNVVQARSDVAAPTEQSSGELVNATLPLNEGKKVKRRVIHSVPVPAPRKKEVLAFDGDYLATIDPLPFNTFLSTRVTVGETPTSTEPTGLAKSSVQSRGEATEPNGFNCTQGRSGYQTPCTVPKAGAIRITQNAVDPATGQPATLYVNLVAWAKPLLARRVRGAPQVGLAPLNGLRVARYGPG
jgi:hypothetical protein